MSDDRHEVLLDILLRQPDLAACTTLSQWLPVWKTAGAAYAEHGPYVAAVAAAVQADRMAWAFFCGNQGAVQAAFRRTAGAADGIASFCANETGRKLTAIATSLRATNDGTVLEGRKAWSLADAVDLYVLARAADGPARGPGSLVVVRVPRTAPGVTMDAARPQAVVPELPHCEVAFTDVPIAGDQSMPGDGYADYARPFRLREDVFVTGCTLAFLLAHGHAAGWPTRWRQRCIAAIVTLGRCAELDPSDPSAELLSAGALSLAGTAIDEADAFREQEGSETTARWIRDRPILGLGREARRQRAVSAWERLGWTDSPA